MLHLLWSRKKLHRILEAWEEEQRNWRKELYPWDRYMCDCVAQTLIPMKLRVLCNETVNEAQASFLVRKFQKTPLNIFLLKDFFFFFSGCLVMGNDLSYYVSLPLNEHNMLLNLQCINSIWYPNDMRQLVFLR